MRVMGIDPSLTKTGIAHSDGRITATKNKASDGDMRLADIYSQVFNAAIHADVAVIEDLPKHAMAAGITGMVQGVTRLALINSATDYVSIPPATLKKFASGKGNCDKAFMRQAWLELTGEDNPDNDQVDAAFLRQIGLHLVGLPTLDFPEDRLAAVSRYKGALDG